MIDPALWNLIPPVRRARGDRLYGADQKHWVDLWKQDGAWLLGHRPEGAAREWKNQVDKGLSAWLPSPWARRLEPLVKQLLPGTDAVRLFRNADRAPAAAVWRPWDEQTPGPGPWRLVLPSGPAQAVALAFPSGADVPPPELTSPAEAAAVVQAAAQVLRFTADPRAQGLRTAAAAAFDRWIGPSGRFVRRGLWFTTAAGVDHAELFRGHLAAGFLLNPDPAGAHLVPLELSEGEWKAWRNAAEGRL